MTLETALLAQILIFAVGFLLGVGFWQITNIVQDTRWLGQERRSAERRKEGL